MSMPSKAGAGQTMLDNFHPIMQPAQVQKTADYYYKTFVNLRPIAEAGPQLASRGAQAVRGPGSALGVDPGGGAAVPRIAVPGHGRLARGPPAAAAGVFANVSPGLAHYKPLVDVMQANVSNYQKVDSLPSFRLFTWFFVIPGVLLVLLAGWPLLAGLLQAYGSLNT